ncbi:hypothetical protein H5392_01015 [Tessaracoccus sp. MC1865]|uniref:hypothetical protein n=1 Tax=Tessaracoccus sp. MC1865 TaxID=2760310 RepID=UPI001603BE29|nr:hypothetical protein [Tessaracoccus sp. MC1865]MBB1482440.1 hypothetical protein [Tessaracoccus sp. MC1865]QTO38103.1 hypothetical protein J7D54_03065 [Tessaracoccus sp. MC1865]
MRASFSGGETADIDQFVAERRERVATTAISELRAAKADELPALLHRLAGKLDSFGLPTAGEAVRELLGDLPGEASELSRRAHRIAALLSCEVAS